MIPVAVLEGMGLARIKITLPRFRVDLCPSRRTSLDAPERPNSNKLTISEHNDHLAQQLGLWLGLGL